jgi:hypothetical protein
MLQPDLGGMQSCQQLGLLACIHFSLKVHIRAALLVAFGVDLVSDQNLVRSDIVLDIYRALWCIVPKSRAFTDDPGTGVPANLLPSCNNIGTSASYIQVVECNVASKLICWFSHERNRQGSMYSGAPSSQQALCSEVEHHHTSIASLTSMLAAMGFIGMSVVLPVGHTSY